MKECARMREMENCRLTRSKSSKCSSKCWERTNATTSSVNGRKVKREDAQVLATRKRSNATK